MVRMPCPYIDVMTTGDAKGRVFTFPIPTYNITPDFPWESDNAAALFEMTAKYGLPRVIVLSLRRFSCSCYGKIAAFGNHQEHVPAVE